MVTLFPYERKSHERKSRAPKKNCSKHYVWEKIRSAEIDLERCSPVNENGQAVDQKRQMRTALKSRAKVLGLLLHSIHDHPLSSADGRIDQIGSTPAMLSPKEKKYNI